VGDRAPVGGELPPSRPLVGLLPGSLVRHPGDLPRYQVHESQIPGAPIDDVQVPGIGRDIPGPGGEGVQAPGLVGFLKVGSRDPFRRSREAGVGKPQGNRQ
jgi:hypothetical protein